MKMKYVMILGFAMMAATVFAGEKFSPDLNNLAPEWKLNSAKIMEEGGQKYLHLDDIGGGMASVTYSTIPLNGVKQVKVSFKYRTNVESSALHHGAWFLVAFFGGEKDQYEGVFPELKNEWTEADKTINVPEGATSFLAQLRIQLETPKDKNSGKFIDAKDIVVELFK